MNPIEAKTAFERARIASLSIEHTNDPIHTKPLKNDHESNGDDTDVMLTIARTEIRDLIAEKVDLIYEKRTQAEVQDQIEEALVDILQLGNHAPSRRAKTAFAQFLEMIMMKLFSREAADDIMSERFE